MEAITMVAAGRPRRVRIRWWILSLVLASLAFVLVYGRGRFAGRAGVTTAVDAKPAGAGASAAVTPSVMPGRPELVGLGSDADGRVWAVGRYPASAFSTVLLAEASGTVKAYPSLRSAVDGEYGRISSSAWDAALWAEDPQGRLWLGPAYYDGHRWTEATGPAETASELRYEERSVAQRERAIWVPFRRRVDCAEATCMQYGVQAFGPTGPMEIPVVFDGMERAQREDLPWLHFAWDEQRDLYLVGPESLWSTSAEAWIPYRDAAPSSAFRSLLASAAATGSEGGIDVFASATTLELARVNLRLRLRAGAWDPPELLDGGVLAPAGDNTPLVTAAAYDMRGGLWLGTSAGAVGLRSGDSWSAAYDLSNSSLDGSAIIGLLADADGSLWVATRQALHLYRSGSWRKMVEPPIAPPNARFLPYASRGAAMEHLQFAEDFEKAADASDWRIGDIVARGETIAHLDLADGELSFSQIVDGWTTRSVMKEGRDRLRDMGNFKLRVEARPKSAADVDVTGGQRSYGFSLGSHDGQTCLDDPSNHDCWRVTNVELDVTGSSLDILANVVLGNDTMQTTSLCSEAGRANPRICADPANPACVLAAPPPSDQPGLCDLFPEGEDLCPDDWVRQAVPKGLHRHQLEVRRLDSRICVTVNGFQVAAVRDPSLEMVVRAGQVGGGLLADPDGASLLLSADRGAGGFEMRFDNLELVELR